MLCRPRRDTEPALWASFPSLASDTSAPGPLSPPQGSTLTCQRLRARRNFSCLVLMKWASSAGTDFWGSPGRRATLGVGGPLGHPAVPADPHSSWPHFPVSQASPCSAYSPGTRGGQGTWQHWAEPWGGKEGPGQAEVSWSLRQAQDLRCVYSPHGLLQSSLDKVLGILTEVGGHGATPGHPPF